MNQTKSLKLRMKSPYPYSLVLPALIVYGVLYVLPAASGFLLSFFNVKTFKISSFTFAGLENYATVLRNPYFSVAIKNTLLFSIVTTLGKVGFGLALALLVNNRFRGVNYMRTVFFLPAVLNNVAVGLVFRSMMHPSGLINRTLTAIGLGALTQNWLTNPKIAIFSCAFVEICWPMMWCTTAENRSGSTVRSTGPIRSMTAASRLSFRRRYASSASP